MRSRDLRSFGFPLPLTVIRAFALLVLATAFNLSGVAQNKAAPSVNDLLRQAARANRGAEYSKAEEFLRQALSADPGRSDIKLELGLALCRQRLLREAYDIVFPIAEADPKNARAFSVLGTILLSAGRFQEARLVLYNAILLDKKEHLAWAGFGQLDFYENNLNESIANLREAVHRGPSEPDYLFSLAQVSARAERYREAADAYREFLRVSETTDKDRRARIKGLIDFLSFLGQSGKLYESIGRPQTTVDFELVGNRPVLPVRVNRGREDLRFVLDTGSGITVLSADAARRLKIKPITRGGHARGIGGDGKFEIVYGFLNEMSLGDVRLKNVPVYIREFHTDANKVDGYIGLGMISKFLTTIDYGEQTFSLRRRDSEEPETPAEGAITLPLRLTSSGFLSGEVQLEGLDGPLNFIVDTGASISVISDRVAKVDAISKFENGRRMRVIGSAGVTENVPAFSLPKVTFGKHSRRGIVAISLDLDMINEASGFEQSGILGGNFLNNYRLTFDFRNSRLTFVPVRQEND